MADVKRWPGAGWGVKRNAALLEASIRELEAADERILGSGDFVESVPGH